MARQAADTTKVQAEDDRLSCLWQVSAVKITALYAACMKMQVSSAPGDIARHSQATVIPFIVLIAADLFISLSIKQAIIHRGICR